MLTGARTICLMHMSDGVFFTGLMEMHSIGDLEMLTGNSIHNTSVSVLRYSVALTFNAETCAAHTQWGL